MGKLEKVTRNCKKYVFFFLQGERMLLAGSCGLAQWETSHLLTDGTNVKSKKLTTMVVLPSPLLSVGCSGSCKADRHMEAYLEVKA